MPVQTPVKGKGRLTARTLLSTLLASRDDHDMGAGVHTQKCSGWALRKEKQGKALYRRGPELQRTRMPMKVAQVGAQQRNSGADSPSPVDHHPSFLACPFAVAL